MSSHHERFLNAILDSATLYAIITIDLDGLVTSWNEGARRLLGWEESEICGKPAKTFFVPEDCARGIPEAEMQTALNVGRSNDERWHQKQDGSRFWASGEMMLLKDETGVVLGFVKIMRDRTDMKMAIERNNLLSQELSHRIKNMIAVIQAICSQTLSGDRCTPEARDTLNARLMALARAHDILLNQSWTSAEIHTLVNGIHPLHAGDNPDRFSIEGPTVPLGPKAALSLALVLHELCTNATKYGALSMTTGRVRVFWTVESNGVEPVLAFCWEETGGPLVTTPARKGFGSKLIERSFGGFGAKAQMTYHPEGLQFLLTAPLRVLQEA